MIELEIFDDYQPVENNFGRKDRYTYAIVSCEGQKMFLKTSLLPSGIGDIKRELVWADFMKFVAKRYPAAKIEAPGGYKLLNESNLLMEYIDAPVVAEPRDGTAWKRQIDKYIDMMAVLDQAAENYTIPTSLRTYQTRQIEQALERWLRDVEVTSDIERTMAYIKRHKDRLTYRLQHGDLTPWQIFEVDDRWVIFDGERAGDDLPRFNDLAYSYGRLAIRCQQETTADYMVSQFIERRSIDQKSFWKEFKLVLAFRLLGMYGDTVRDKSVSDLETARRLLKLLMDDELMKRINLLTTG